VWRLSIGRERVNDVFLVTPVGRVGHATSGELTEVLLQALAAGERRIVIDATRLEYMSSAGVLAIEAVAARLATMSGEIVLCALSEPVRLALDLAGLLEHVPVEPTREAAITRLASDAGS
jgi:anti-anti-sigma factor